MWVFFNGCKCEWTLQGQRSSQTITDCWRCLIEQHVTSSLLTKKIISRLFSLSLLTIGYRHQELRDWTSLSFHLFICPFLLSPMIPFPCAFFSWNSSVLGFNCLLMKRQQKFERTGSLPSEFSNGEKVLEQRKGKLRKRGEKKEKKKNEEERKKEGDE